MKLFGHELRELWLAKDIDATHWPSAIPDGHAMTLTDGAYKGTTTEGLTMRAGELVTITDPAALAIVDNLTIVFPTFKPDTLFSAASSADMGIMNFNNGSVVAHLESTTGAMDILFKDADGGADEVVSTTKVSWAAGYEWQVGFTFVKAADATISVKVYINGLPEATNAHCDTNLTDGAGDTTYGYDGTTYLTSTITRGPMVWSTTALSAAQMLAVNKGNIPTTNLVLYHKLNEGRGLAVDDKASGATCDGVISGTYSATIWKYGDAKQPCVSYDSISDYVVSATGVDIGTAFTLVWIGKMKSPYTALGVSEALFDVRIDANNLISLFYYHTSDAFLWDTYVGGVSTVATATSKPSVNDIWILMATYSEAAVSLYLNGALEDSGTSAAVKMPHIHATASLGRQGATAARYGISDCMGAAIIGAKLTAAEAEQLTIDINDWLGLGISII